MGVTRPRFFRFAAVFFANSISRSQIAIAAPESRNRSTIARPMPCAPPVTIALRPLRSILFDIAASRSKTSERRRRWRALKMQWCIAGARRELVERALFVYLSRCGARDGRPAFPRPQAQAPSPSFTEGTYDFVVLGFRTAEFRGTRRLPVR